jgi:hypothetical protein
MRAVFTVEIPASGIDSYPNHKEFLALVRAFGWEDMKIKNLSDEEKEAKYREYAEDLWKEMPEVADEEKPFVIFYGILQDNRTKFVITRMNESQATFRLLHTNLGRLQQSTTKLIRSIVRSHANAKGLEISQNRITIYERGHEETLIVGRVIPDAARELWVADRKNILLVAGSLIFLLISIILIRFVNSQNSPIWGSALERLATGFVTSAVVAGIGLVQTYVEIKEEKLIDWKVASYSTPNQVS